MSVSPGRRFMIDLLVSSLMADGGLESALNAAITAEIQVSVLNGWVLTRVFSLIMYSALFIKFLIICLPQVEPRKCDSKF